MALMGFMRTGDQPILQNYMVRPCLKKKEGKKEERKEGCRKQRGSKRVRPGFAPAGSSLTKQI